MPEALVDYYALLGVARTAARVEIESAIKKGIRTWSKQTSRPELDKRQEAERKMQQLREARETLLDDERRRWYDQQLAVAATSVAASPSGDEDWLALARNALNINDFHTAARAAAEARRTNERSAEVWSILARANAGLGRTDDAVFEAQRALQLEPDNVDHRYTLAEIFEQLGDWHNAMQTYEYLARLEPNSELPRFGIASVYLSAGDHTRAIGLLDQLYETGQDRRMAGDYLAMALMNAAQEVPRVREDDGYAITAPDEISRMRNMLDRAVAVTQDPDLQSDIASMRHYIDRMAGREIIWGRIFSRVGLWWVGASALSVCCSGFDNDFAVIAALVIFGGAAGLVAYALVPRWKLNRMADQSRYLTY
jgi:tetratricopeptide (TPR) repeat protein